MHHKALITFLLFTIYLNGYGHQPFSYKIIENKGQWHHQVRYRVDVSGGILFFEEQKQTLLLYDQELISNYHNGIAHLTHPDMLMQYHALQFNWEGSQKPTYVQENRFSHFYNYFFGKNEKNWQREIYPARILWAYNLYPGIHQKWYTEEGQLKYDLVVKPGASPEQITLSINGSDNLKVTDNQLLIKTELGDLINDKPITYQLNSKGEKEWVTCEYKLKNGKVKFELGSYDPSRELIIDPTLIFSTFSGSTSNNFGYTATFDSEGYLYSGSTVFGASGAYPTTIGAFQQFFKGGSSGIGGTDVGITKYAQDGQTLIYSTLLGGNADEMPHSLFVNTRDELYVMGTTGSENFPVTNQAYDTLFAGSNNPVNLFQNNGLGVVFPRSCDLFITRFSNDGSNLLASTFLGGTDNDGINNRPDLRYNYADEARGEIEIDFEDNVYIASCSQSSDFPIVGNTFQTSKGNGQDGVVAKLSSDLSQVIWSSFYGGNDDDALYSISLTKNGNVYVAGGTNSTDLPAFSNFIFSVFVGGRSDGFMGRISSDGTTLQESSYLGTTDYEQVYFIETDKDENVYLLGQTESQGLAYIVNLTPQSAPYLTQNAGQFIIKFNPELDSIWWSTRFGRDDPTQPRANPNISPTAFLVDLCNSIYISGWGGATNQQNYLNNFAGTTDSMLVTNDAFQDSTDGSDFYLFVLSDDATTVNYASYYGGSQAAEHVDGGTSRFDRQGKIYQSVCAGCGGFSDFPIFPNNAWADSNAAHSQGCNNAVFKMDFLLPIVAAQFRVPERACAPYTFQPIENSLTQNSTKYFWDFGDGSTSSDTLPTKIFSTPGTYQIKLSLSDTNSCNLSDTLIRIIKIESDTTTLQPLTNLCLNDSVALGVTPKNNHSYTWFPSIFVSNSTTANTIAFPDSSIQLALFEDDGICVDTFYFPVLIDSATVYAPNDTILCSTINSLNLAAQTTSNWQYVIWSSNSSFSDTLNFIIDSTVSVLPQNALNSYFVRLINTNGCVAEDTIQIILSDFALEAMSDTLICQNDSAWIRAFSLNPLDSLSYNWSPTNNILTSDDSSSILVYPLSNEWFFVQSNNSVGCRGIDSVLVNRSTLISDSVRIISEVDTVFRGRTINLFGTPNSNNFEFEWFSGGNALGNQPELSLPLDSSTTFLLKVTDPNNENCSYSTTYRIEAIEILCDIPEIFIPSAFSPNGDGLNDNLHPLGKNIKNYEISIYNRWGELIVELNESTPTWNGNLNNEAAQEGVYYYEADITCIDEQKLFLKGDVSLIR